MGNRTTREMSAHADQDGDATGRFSVAAVLDHANQSARVLVNGELCAATAPILRRMLDGLVADGVRSIIVDMADLRLCTSHGVDVLDAARARLGASGGCLSIERAHGIVRKVLDIVGMPLGQEKA